MSLIGRILSNYYRPETVIDVLGFAIERDWSICFINRRTHQRQRLDVEQLLTLRKDRVVYILVESARVYQHPLGGSSQGTADYQPVHVIDLSTDENTFNLIKMEFGNGDKSNASKQPAQSKVQDGKTLATDDELSEHELDLAYYRNPKDRDPRLREEAVEILIANPHFELNEIHAQLLTKEKGKSDISLDTLKHVVKLREIKSMAKKRIENNQKVNE